MNKLLIVDDSAAMRNIVAHALRTAELSVDTVLEAGSALEALARLESDPEIRLVLSQLDLPEVDGVEFVRAVRELHDKDRLPLIMLTADGAEAMMKRAFDEGANGFVPKPLTPESVRRALEAYLG